MVQTNRRLCPFPDGGCTEQPAKAVSQSPPGSRRGGLPHHEQPGGKALCLLAPGCLLVCPDTVSGSTRPRAGPSRVRSQPVAPVAAGVARRGTVPGPSAESRASGVGDAGAFGIRPRRSRGPEGDSPQVAVAPGQDFRVGVVSIEAKRGPGLPSAPRGACCIRRRRAMGSGYTSARPSLNCGVLPSGYSSLGKSCLGSYQELERRTICLLSSIWITCP